jgi:hypothetical protein
MYAVEGHMKQNRGRVFKSRNCKKGVMKRRLWYPPDTPTGEDRARRHAMMAGVVASTGHLLRSWLRLRWGLSYAKEEVE